MLLVVFAEHPREYPNKKILCLVFFFQIIFNFPLLSLFVGRKTFFPFYVKGELSLVDCLHSLEMIANFGSTTNFWLTGWTVSCLALFTVDLLCFFCLNDRATAAIDEEECCIFVVLRVCQCLSPKKSVCGNMSFCSIHANFGLECHFWLCFCLSIPTLGTCLPGGFLPQIHDC